MRIGKVAAGFLAIAGALSAAPTLPTLWEASVVVNEVEIPFRFELQQGEDRSPIGAFFNGDERVRSTSGAWKDGALTLEFAHYATKLEAKWDGSTLTGTYGRTGRPPYAFRAKPWTRSEVSEQPDGHTETKVPSIAGQWEIAVKSPKGESAWKLFVRQSGPEVSASILRVDGDTGLLTGSWKGGQFVLSHFSGARPSLLEIKPNADGSLTLVQNAKTTYSAVKSSEAREKGLPEPADPTRWTSVADPTQPLRFRAKDLNGVEISDSDPRFAGKVVLVNITGSWCPNCHDEAPFLAEIYRKYRKQGLEIVAVSFEEAEQLADPTRLRAFIKQYGLEYPVLLGGEPADLKAVLPQAVNLNTWPATFFIGRDGLVRGAHAGFASKATGEEHVRVKAEFQHKIESLLAEKLQSAR
jgi:thiol-disulfide isomerase/thioredoxin